MTDKERYDRWQEEQGQAWEALCRRCGACCGVAEGDPCEHVVRLPDGRYGCRIYDHRLGQRRTRSGRLFQCVPIRSILFRSWPGDACCGYKNNKRALT